MKNYPNQASSFGRVRGTLTTIREVWESGGDPNDDDVLGYQAARSRVYTFRGLTGPEVTAEEIQNKIEVERRKPGSNQGARTFARELRRTLRDLGWINDEARLTESGEQLLATTEGSVEEQALLVEGLLRITVADQDDHTEHRPVRTLLRLLAHRPSPRRVGLELALEPHDDSEEELNRVLALYDLPEVERAADLGVSQHQLANAVKIFPSLARHAGLVLEDENRTYSLSQDGWLTIGQEPVVAARAMKRYRGRRTTVGRLVSPSTIARNRRNIEVPKGLSRAEQAMAARRLSERTSAHQLLVARMAQYIPSTDGQLFEDEFSYDMLWVPNDSDLPLSLFEMKTVTGEVDAYAQGRDALGQLKYYAYFQVAAAADNRELSLYFVANERVPEALCEFFTSECVGVIVSPPDAEAFGANPAGERFLELLRKRRDALALSVQSQV